MLIHVGFGGYVEQDRLIAVLPPSAAPTKRLITEARTANRLIDMTSGRRTKTVAVADSGDGGTVILLAITPETVVGRAQAGPGWQGKEAAS